MLRILGWAQSIVLDGGLKVGYNYKMCDKLGIEYVCRISKVRLCPTVIGWVYEAQIINKSDYLGVLSSASDGKSAEFGCKYIKNTTLIM